MSSGDFSVKIILVFILFTFNYNNPGFLSKKIENKNFSTGKSRNREKSWVFKLKKKMKHHFVNNSFVLYGITKLKLQKKSFPTAPINYIQYMLDNLSEDREIDNKLRKASVAAMQYHLTHVNGENKEFSKFYSVNILDVENHGKIITKFWELKHNVLTKTLPKTISDHPQDTGINGVDTEHKRIIDTQLKECLKKARTTALLTASVEDREWDTMPAANNLYFNIRQTPYLEGLIGTRMDPAFRMEEMDVSSHILCSESVNEPGYEGPGKIKISISYFSESTVLTFPFFSYDVDLDLATKFSLSIMPNNTLKVWEYPDVSSIIFLRLPDILGVFPSTGAIYAKVFIGVGVITSWDIGVKLLSAVVFHIGVFGYGFLQIGIKKNLTRIAHLAEKVMNNVGLLNVDADSEKPTLKNYINNTISLQIDSMDIGFAFDRRKRPTRMQRLLRENG